MAEETTRKLKYLGLEYDEGVADFLALNAEAYARHLHLNDVLRNAFMQEVHSRLGAMRNGGDGATPISTDVIWTGAITGNLKSGPKSKLGISRNGFSASDLANSFFSGGIGRYNTLMREKTASDELKAKDEAKAKLLTWSKHTGDGGSTLGSRLRGMWGNDLDMVHWADSSGDTLVDGVRSRTGRYGALNKVLSQYRDDLLGGKWGDPTNNEDMQNELSLLNDALNNGDPSALDAAYQRLLGNEMFDRLMFTGEKYLTPEGLREADINRLQQLALDYINGVEGVSNPYDQNSSDERERQLYEQTENNRLAQANNRLISGIGTNPDWTDEDDSYVFNTTIAAMDPSLFSTFNVTDMRGNLDAMNGVAHSKYGRDMEGSSFGEFGHDDYTGYADGDESLEGTYYQPYLKYLLDNSDEGPDDRVSYGGYAARSNRAIKAKASVDWAYNKIMNDPNKANYAYDNGYVLPELIDWQRGTAYVLSFDGGFGLMRRVSLKKLYNGLLKESPLKLIINNAYILQHYRQSHKQGGVLKALNGTQLTDAEYQKLMQSLNVTLREPFVPIDPRFQTLQETDNTALQARIQKEDARFAEAAENGLEKLYVKDRNNSTDFSTTDWMRIGTAVADLTGAVVSMAGFTPVGAAIGAGSTLSLFAMDISDNDVSMGDALKALGVGLTLDALTLIPGEGMFALVAKAAKKLSKYAVPIINMMLVAGNSPEAITTAKKVFSGDFKNITVGEWKGFARALNGLTNATSGAKIAYAKRWGKFSKALAPKGTEQWTFGIGNKKIKLNKAEISEINRSADPEAALRAKFTGDNALADSDDLSSLFTLPGKVASKIPGKIRSKIPGLGKRLKVDNSKVTTDIPIEDYRRYVAALRKIRMDRNKVIRLGGIRGRLTKYGLDDAQAAFGGVNPSNFINVFRRGHSPALGGFEQTLAAAQLSLLGREEAFALSNMLKKSKRKPTDQRAVLENLDKAEETYNKGGGDKKVSDLETALGKKPTDVISKKDIKTNETSIKALEKDIADLKTKASAEKDATVKATMNADIATKEKALKDLLKILDLLKELRKMRTVKRMSTEHRKNVENYTRSITDFTKPEYAAAKGVGAVSDATKFLRFLKALNDKGYSEGDIKYILGKKDLIDMVRKIYGFKKGGSIHKLFTGGITQTSNILPLLDGVKKLNTFVSNNGLSALELIKHSLAVSQNKRAIDTLNSVQAPLYSFTPLSYKVNTSLVDLPYRRAADKMRSSADTAANKYATSEARLATKLLADNLANDYELQGALATSLRLAQELAKMLEVENKNAQMADAINRQNTLLAYSKRLSDANNTAALDRFKVSQNELLLLQIQKGMATTAESKRKLAKIEALNNDEEYNILKTAAADAKTRYDADPENAELKKAYLDAVAARNRRLALFLADYDLANPALPLMPFASIRGIQAPETPYWQTVALKNEKGGSIGKLTQAELVKLFRQLLANKTKEKKAYLDLLNKYAERMHKGNKSEAYSMYLKLLNK